MTVEVENDKNAVIALREIAEKTVIASDVREGFIHAMQHEAEIDEPEATTAPTLPQPDRPKLGRDDPLSDRAVDTITEDELLRRMGVLVPMDAHTRGGSSAEGHGELPQDEPSNDIGRSESRHDLTRTGAPPDDGAGAS